jgi:hypothetical protein
MKKQHFIFNIAGLPLKTARRDTHSLPQGFELFTAERSRGPKSLWRLDFASRGKKRAGGPRFFDGHITVDAEKKRLTRFLPKKTKTHAGRMLDSRLLSYSYAQILASHGGMLVHAAAVIRNERAYLFFGKSGDGKSTAAAISRRFGVIGDDVIAVKRQGRDFIAYPTPWKQNRSSGIIFAGTREFAPYFS